MKDKLKKFWNDHKEYAPIAAFAAGLGVVTAIVIRDATRKETIQEDVEDYDIQIDNWINDDGLGLSVITEAGTEYELPGWSPHSI